MEKHNHLIFRCKLYTSFSKVKRARLMPCLSLTKPFGGFTYTEDVAVKLYRERVHAMDNNLEGKTACVRSCKKIDVPTEQEVCALNELRCIKERVRELKKKISGLSAGLLAGTRDDLMDREKEMADLKEEWLSWEEKRQQAARERMIILGHEEHGAR
jgi:hypothetical protein